MRRPIALTILMWFCAVYAIGAGFGIVAVFFDVGRLVGGYSIGGMPVTRAQWLTIAAPLVAAIAILMAMTAIGLKQHSARSRLVFLAIWPLIIFYGIACAILGAVPWSLGGRAVVDAAVVGLLAAWLLFRHKPSRDYFISLARQPCPPHKRAVCDTREN